MKDKKPTFYYERAYWAQGIDVIAGIDEVGMGALAGPVVAAAVIFKPDTVIKGLRDSKLLSPKQRQEKVGYIKEKALAWGIGQASVEEIQTLNIRRASHRAMQRSSDNLSVQPKLLLIDGLPAQPHHIPAVNIIKGDQLCLSIAAASILAKVYRDELMEQLSREYPRYGFAQHKGYPTTEHKAALRQWGVTPMHRLTYAPVQEILTHQSA